MLVKDIIEGIETKKFTVSQLAEKYQVTKRTIQGKIKSLGFTWDAKGMKYDHTAVPEDTYSLVFDDLMQSKGNTSRKHEKSNTKHSGSNESDMYTARKETATSKQEEEYDRLDYLLFGRQKNDADRMYRGYYIDNDLLSIIDNVKTGNKSDLINECLRYVFKQKGLL